MILSSLLLACGLCAAEPLILEKPISFSAARSSATLAYIRAHYGPARDITIRPEVVVLHWTGSATLDAGFKTMDRETLGASRPELAGAGDVNVSAHFLVDRDGTIYRLMPETVMARHVIGLNLAAIGVENVGGAGDRDDLTTAQLEADAWLVRDLKRRFPDIRYLIGHHEYRRMEGTPLWKERDRGYRTSKSDPGPRFLSAVRARVGDLKLLAAPRP